MSRTPEPPRLYTRKQVAQILACSQRRVIQLEYEGKLAAVLDGRFVKYRADEIARYIDSLPSHEPRTA